MPGRHLFAGRPEQIVYATSSFLFPDHEIFIFLSFFRALPLDVHVSKGKRKYRYTPKRSKNFFFLLFFFPPVGNK
jgi:hypothetical protein